MTAPNTRGLGHEDAYLVTLEAERDALREEVTGLRGDLWKAARALNRLAYALESTNASRAREALVASDIAAARLAATKKVLS